MKIIKNGKEKNFITRCYSCGSDLEYTLEDVYKKEIDSIAAIFAKDSSQLMIGEVNCISCPVCGKELYALLVTKEEYKKHMNDPQMYACG